MPLGTAYDTKEQIRQAIDIADLIGGYIPLRRQGRGYVGICPWHDDSRPSLQVNPDRQSWKCWVCDIGGDIFSFVMQREGIEFREALTMLAERAGVTLNTATHQAAVKPGSPGDKNTLYQAMAWAEQQFHENLLRAPEAEPARQYLTSRGITTESARRFHLGFSPDRWQWLVDRAKSTPFSLPVLDAVGLVARSEKSGQHYDRFKGRLMFSIRDTQRRPIAFGGRVLPQSTDQRAAKYINSPESRLFSKSEQLYALDIVRDSVAKSRQVVVVEGYTDAIVAAQAGLENVTAVLGTALGPRHIRLLRRFADTITLVLDGDEAGQKRTNEILELFVAEHVDLRILTLPDGLDPCDFVLQRGGDAFRQLLAGAVDALEHELRIATRGIDPTTETHRAHQALENVLATVAKAPRLQSGTTTSMRLREQQILARLAREFRIAESDLRARLNDLRRRTKAPQRASEKVASPAVSISSLNPKESELIEILALHGELVARAISEISPDQLSPGPLRVIYETYGRCCATIDSPQFNQVLTELEDPRLKNLLVQLDERAQAKESQAHEAAPLRLQRLIVDFRRGQEVKQIRHQVAQLEAGKFDEQEELKVLLELHEREKRRQMELNGG